jgi:hypothetical protein
MNPFQASLVRLLLIASLVSCKKTDSSTADTSSTSQTIRTWLLAKKSEATPNKNSLVDRLLENLDFGNARTEHGRPGEDFLVIPVQQDFLVEKKGPADGTLALLLVVDGAGTIKRGNLVLFTPEAGHPPAPLSVGTFEKLFSNQPIGRSGSFSFMTATGNLLYKLGYRDGKPYSIGKPVRKQQAPGAGARIATCFAWYLDTDYYVGGVLVDHTSFFIGIHCFNETGGGGGLDSGCDNQWIESICPGDSGGGNGAVDCCIPDANFQFTSTSEGEKRSVVCGPAAIDPQTGLMTKNCTFSWYFNTSTLLWYSWRYISIESTTNEWSGGAWKFKSVVHAGTTYDGAQPPCFTATEHVIGAVGSISSDRKKASMQFDYTLIPSSPCLPLVSGRPFSGHASIEWLASEG